MSPDLTYVFDWAQVVAQMDPSLVGIKGSLVFANDNANTGASANFAMFGDAYSAGGAPSVWNARIPVLPMNDGQDPTVPVLVGEESNPRVTLDNQVNYRVVYRSKSLRSFRVCAPATTRLQANSRYLTCPCPVQPPNPRCMCSGMMSIKAIPLIGQGTDTQAVQVVVFDNNEDQCSSTVSLPNELNVVWISNPPMTVTPGRLGR